MKEIVGEETSPGVQAFDWLNIHDRDDKGALYAYFTSIFGDPIDIASGKIEVLTEAQDGERFAGLLDKARQILDDERFFNWQVAFPGVWSEWESNELHGGFDAVDRQSALGPDES